MIELLLLGTHGSLPGKSEADMATSKSAQLTHQDISVATSAMALAQSDARFFNAIIIGALTACWRSICSMPTRPTATKFSYWRPDCIHCRSISRISLSICASDFWSASRTTGTTSPRSLPTATPM